VLEVNKSVGGPQVALKLVTCDHLSTLGNQGNQNVKRLRLKLDSDTGFVQRTRLHVHIEDSEVGDLPVYLFGFHGSHSTGV
jgi:hypothetical protein